VIETFLDEGFHRVDGRGGKKKDLNVEKRNKGMSAL